MILPAVVVTYLLLFINATVINNLYSIPEHNSIPEDKANLFKHLNRLTRTKSSYKNLNKIPYLSTNEYDLKLDEKLKYVDIDIDSILLDKNTIVVTQELKMALDDPLNPKTHLIIKIILYKLNKANNIVGKNTLLKIFNKKYNDAIQSLHIGKKMHISPIKKVKFNIL